MADQRWEYCEVFRKKEPGCFYTGYYFYAEAISPVKGKYIAQKSNMISTWTFLLHFPYDEPSAKVLEKSHDEIVNLLVKDRWEPLPERGDNWWNVKFKRSV